MYLTFKNCKDNLNMTYLLKKLIDNFNQPCLFNMILHIFSIAKYSSECIQILLKKVVGKIV